ncbi:MAG: hypothetical protein K0S00_3407 [Xanthobacteraceae bacterium]|jgi:hypothetical protein|nr:hypothetical protein [Xanthobacteraceae bacterium]
MLHVVSQVLEARNEVQGLVEDVAINLRREMPSVQQIVPMVKSMIVFDDDITSEMSVISGKIDRSSTRNVYAKVFVVFKA